MEKTADILILAAKWAEKGGKGQLRGGNDSAFGVHR